MIGQSDLKVAVFPGDGIGTEIIDFCLKVLEKVQKKVGGFKLSFEILPAGAAHYLETGVDITDENMRKAGEADAILLAGMGLPDVRYPDGTEIAPHLTMRIEFDLYAGVRPCKVYPNVPTPLRDPRAANIDFVVLRECTEGLFASVGKGEVIDDREARETLVITRSTCEKFFDFGFKLARKRKLHGGEGLVTCVDKSNVFRAYAFFRKIFNERAALFPDIKTNYNFIDAQCLYLVRNPWDYDVLVAENMFADVLSDLGGGIIGGMGMAPCAELGDEHGLFQPAHGTAPDIAGQNKANPIAMFLSAALMLDWLGERHGIEALENAAATLRTAVETGFAKNKLKPVEFGGPHGTGEITRTVIDSIKC
jgi:3-isopropylmalate dehydrogenase